jgi:uncharacterized protein (TIGR01370 family)
MPGAAVRRHALIVALACLLAVGGCAANAGRPSTRPANDALPGTAGPVAPVDARLAAVSSWAFAIGDGTLDGSPRHAVARLGIFDLVVVDGEEATPAEIAAVQAEGALVLGYLSIGTIEPWRSWYTRLEPYRLAPLGDWDEYYADVTDPASRRIVSEQIAPELLSKGFDGLFLDNIDMPETYPDAAADMYDLIDALSRLTAGRGALLFAQNGEDVFDGSFWGLLDGWNREDVTWTYDFGTGTYEPVPEGEHDRALDLLAHVRATGLVTLATDYVASPGGVEEAACIDAARSVGALPYVSDIELARVPEVAFPGR